MSEDASISAGGGLQGVLHGGQQPITGAHIYLMQINSNKYAGKSKSLTLANPDGTDGDGTYVLTDANGNFSLNGQYSCTSGKSIYLLAEGGNPGLSPDTTNNTAATMMAGLGTCPTSGNFAATIPYIVVNELSTVGMAYAFAGFASDSSHIGSSGSAQALVGLTNAFANLNNMISLGNGAAYTKTPAVPGYSAVAGLSANGTVPQAKLNLLANIAASCINTAGPTSANCAKLFLNSKDSNGNKPSNVADALINIAQNPSANVSTLMSLTGTTAPFQPSLATTPSDFTLNIAYKLPNAATPARLAVDAAGNVWVTMSGNNILEELSPTGVVYSGTTGFTGGGMSTPVTLSVDSAGDIWIANQTSSRVSVFNAGGTPLAAAGYPTEGNTATYGIAAAHTGKVWVSGNNNDSSYSTVNFGNGTASQTVTGSTYNSSITEGSDGTVWSVSYVNNNLTSISTLGLVTSHTGGGLASPTSVADDATGDFWISNQGANTVTEFVENLLGLYWTGTAYSGGGINAPWIVALDGAGSVWVGNNNGTISQLSNAGTAMSPATGFPTGSTTQIYGLAPDPSGDLWASSGDGTVYQFIGAGSPTVTPITYNKAGTQP